MAGESRSDDEIVLKVTPPTQAVALEVVLYPQDDEWECSCNSKARACVHVAGAIIALTQEATDRLPTGVGRYAVQYRLMRRGRGLAMTRVLERDGDEEPLRSTLTAVVSGRVPGPPVSVDASDLELDRLVGRIGATPLPRPLALQVHRELCGSSRVSLDGRPVTLESDGVLPLVRVTDVGEDVLLRIERAPEVVEFLGSGLALCKGDIVRPVLDAPLAGPDHGNLPIEKRYPPTKVAELVTEVLPALKRDMTVLIESGRLPGVSRTMEPRIDFAIDHRGAALLVLPTLVYGDPAVARIDAGRLHQIDLDSPAPIRDLEAEENLAARLRSQLNLTVGRKVELRGREAQLLAAKLRQWHGAEAVVSDRLEAVMDFDDATAVRFQVPGKGSAYASGKTVVSAWRGGLDVVPLIGGGFAQLPTDWLERYGHIVADLLAAREREGELPRYALPDLAELCSALGQPPPPDFSELTPLIAGFDQIPSIDPPDGLAEKLRPYQLRGASWLAFTRTAGLGAILADDMGLGKTVQALSVVDGRTLVVCPRSVTWTWASEAERFRPSLRPHVYHGKGRELDEQADLTITTYALLRRDLARLSAVSWDMIILDEAQAIKNPDSQAARAAYELDGKFKVAMTGTPVENRLEELWSLTHFICPGLFGSRQDFAERYAKPIEDGDGQAAERLRRRLRPFLLRREKSLVAPELPPRTESVVHCELDSDERRVYDAVWAATQSEVVKELEQGRGVMAALEALLRLRQAACHPGLLPGRNDTRSSKVERLVADLEEAAADGHKALVFSQWTSLLDRVEPELDSAGIRYTRLDGSTRDRESVINGFQSPDGPPVLLISLKAGGTGLTLTAADHVFLLDPWWNPAVEDQAADRAHRIGQDKPVFVYRLVAKDTVEERILKLQERKRALANVALEGGQLAEALSREDLLELLR